MNKSPNDRYVTRLRAKGFDEHDRIPLEALGSLENLEVWDTVEKCVVKRNAAGDWVPED
jgi:hypothetical protein